MIGSIVAHGFMSSSLDAWPLIGNQGRWLCPGNFHDGILKPWVAEIGVLRNDDLEAGDFLGGKIMKHQKQLPDFFQIGVPLRFLDGAGDGFVNLFRWEIDLSWLIQEEKRRHRFTILRGKVMQSQERPQMVGQMVCATSGLVHRNRPLRTIRDHCQLTKVEPEWKFGKLRFQLFDVAADLIGNDVQHRSETVSYTHL